MRGSLSGRRPLNTRIANGGVTSCARSSTLPDCEYSQLRCSHRLAEQAKPVTRPRRLLSDNYFPYRLGHPNGSRLPEEPPSRTSRVQTAGFAGVDARYRLGRASTASGARDAHPARPTRFDAHQTPKTRWARWRIAPADLQGGDVQAASGPLMSHNPLGANRLK